MDDDRPDALDALAAAVQAFVNAGVDSPHLVDNALVLWEDVSYSDEGEPQRRIRYAVPTSNFTMSGTLGLLDAGGTFVRRDILGARDEDE